MECPSQSVTRTLDQITPKPPLRHWRARSCRQGNDSGCLNSGRKHDKSYQILIRLHIRVYSMAGIDSKKGFLPIASVESHPADIFQVWNLLEIHLTPLDLEYFVAHCDTFTRHFTGKTACI